MIGFKEDLLGRIRNRLNKLPAASLQDPADNDVSLLEDQLQRYQRRLEYWYGRQWHLEGLLVDEDARSITYRDRSATFTRREFQLLLLLVMRSPSFITPHQMLVQAWHDARLPEETLRTYIGRVRSKLQALGVAATIQNRPRRGYALLFSEKPKGE